jgi:hypothetical protein
MQAATATNESPGIVYRVTCENPGCGHTFDLRITAKEAGLLGGTMPCPRCRRHGGTLKPMGRVANKLFAAKLVFKMTGIGTTVPGEEGDLLTDIS